MCKSEIFAEILEIVSQETEISVERILSSDKDTETVDARYLLVHILSEMGFYPVQTSIHLHKTKRTINYIISNFKERLDSGKMMRIYLENIKKQIGNN